MDQNNLTDDTDETYEEKLFEKAKSDNAKRNQGILLIQL